jgi:transposase
MAKPKLPTNRDFDRRFPDDDACLEHLMRVRYGERFDCPKCAREAHYYRVFGKRKRRVYACEWCGHHVSPTAGTPFESTRTPLRSWFQVMFLFTTTRNGVAAKEIQRITGVTYKCAFRMGHKIREYMGYVDGDDAVGGGSAPVEIDTTLVGGKDKTARGDKKIALGMLERGGNVITRHIPAEDGASVHPAVLENVKAGSTIMTDEAKVFRPLGADYTHHSVNHNAHEYVRSGSIHVNSLEGFWANVKREVRGTHVHVSAKYFQNYLGECEYRHNFRHAPHLMFEALVLSFAPPPAKVAS